MMVLVPLLGLMVISVLAFLLIDPMRELSRDNPGVLWQLPETIAVALFVGGAGSALLILLPVTFNDGERIWKWNKIIWFALALPAFFAFFHVLVNDDEFGDLVKQTNTLALIGVCVVVLAVSLVTWLYFKLRAKTAD